MPRIKTTLTPMGLNFETGLPAPSIFSLPSPAAVSEPQFRYRNESKTS